MKIKNLTILAVCTSLLINSVTLSYSILGQTKDPEEEKARKEITQELDKILHLDGLISPNKQDSLSAAQKLTPEFIERCKKHQVNFDEVPEVGKGFGFYTSKGTGEEPEQIWLKGGTRREVLKDLDRLDKELTQKGQVGDIKEASYDYYNHDRSGGDIYNWGTHYIHIPNKMSHIMAALDNNEN